MATGARSVCKTVLVIYIAIRPIDDPWPQYGGMGYLAILAI